MNPSLYTRPNKPNRMIVTRRTGAPEMAHLSPPDVVSVDRFTECHVTPLSVGRRMVEYLGPVGDFMTLEPEGGTGNLVQVLFESGHSFNELTVIERHSGLCSAIRDRFKGEQCVSPINQCFLEYAAEAKGKIEFPRIIMNPPFRHVKKHIAAALGLLGCGGHDVATLVALVPITFSHCEAEDLEELGSDTFSAAKVSTKIIRFRR